MKSQATGLIVFLSSPSYKNPVLFQPVSPAQKIHTVSEITRDIKQLLTDNFFSVWIKGEISNCTHHGSGHIYFSLKDASAHMNAAFFRGANRSLKFELANGMAVIVHGRIDLYEPRGQYQIIVDWLEPEGMGALKLAFEQLKEKLKTEGLFDESRKKPLPFLPGTVGLVTSLHGAAVHDMLTILKRRHPGVNILIYPVRVQGDGAAREIARAIDWFNATQGADMLIVGRGGGSMEDLWAFNEEIVARAIAACTLPIISAVGHETDFSISDFVSDLRAPTPSAAAELCVPLKEELEQKIQDKTQALVQTMRRLMQAHQKEISYLVKSLPTPSHIAESLRHRIEQARHHLESFMKGRLVEWDHTVHDARTKIHLLSPHQVLKRGYVMTKRPTGALVTRKRLLKTGDKLNLCFYDGEAKTKVLEGEQ